jgi:hypothetical protein
MKPSQEPRNSSVSPVDMPFPDKRNQCQLPYLQKGFSHMPY